VKLYAVIRNLRREANLLSHGIFKLIESPINLSDVHAEIKDGGNQQQHEETPEGAPAALCHHCD
jgi:hypothetical protein